MHFVKKACYDHQYTVTVTFEDGTTKAVDLSPYLTGEVFEPLKDVAYFQQFSVHPELETLVWENGADFSPVFLYDIGKVVPSQQMG